MKSIKDYHESLKGKSKERYEQRIGLVNGLDPYKIPNKEQGANIKEYPSVTYPDIVNYLIFTPIHYTADDLLNYKG